MAINFEDQLGSLDDASLMDILGVAPPAPPVVPAVTQAPAVVAAPVVAPAPSPVVSAPVGQPTVKAFDTGIGSLVAAPAPVAAPVVAPVYAPAPSPANLFGLDIAPEFDPTVGLPAFTSAPVPSPVQATAPAPAPAPAAQQGYTAYSGEFSPELIKLMPKSGADIGRGAWQFDTQADREREAYEAQFGGNPETGAAGGSGVNAGRPLTEMKEVQDENGNWISQPTNELDKRYGLTDTTGLVHGTQTVQIDPKHNRVTNAFFDPKTGKMVGQPIVGTYEIPKTNWIENLVTTGLFALPALTLPGFAAGQALMSGAKSASQGDVLGTLAGLGGGIGALPGVDPSTVAAVKTAGDVASKVSALTSGDPLQQLGAIAGITGSEDLTNLSKAANTAALLNAAASGNPNAILKLVTTLGPSAVDLITGGPGAMTTREAEDRQAAADVTDLINNLAFAPTPSPAPTAAIAPSPTPEPAPSVSLDDLAKLYEPAPAPPSLDDLAQLYAPADVTGMPPPPPPPLAPEPAPAPAPSIEDQLRAAGVDFGEQIAPEPAPATTPEDIQTLLDEINTGTPSSVTGNTSAIDALINQADLSNTDWASLYAQPTTNPVTGETIVGGDVSQYAPQEMQIAPENLASYDRTMQDILDKGGFTSQWQNVGSDRVMVQDDGSAIGLNTETGATYGLTPEQTQQMVDLGLLNTAQSGYLSAIGAEPPPAPAAPSGGAGGAGGAPTKTAPAPTATTPTAAKSGLDLNSLLALMALMGGGQEQTPQQQLFNLGRHKSAEEIFGLKEPTTLADILRRRA